MATKTAADRDIDELAERLLRVLESQRLLGPPAYPPTLSRLAELSERRASDTDVPKAVGRPTFKGRAVVAWNKDRKPARDAPVLLASSENLDEAVTQAAPAVLVTLLSRASGEKTQALSITKLGQKLTKKLQKPFKEAIKRGMDHRDLPPEIGCLKNGPSELLFHLDAVQTSAKRAFSESDGRGAPALSTSPAPRINDATPAPDFAAAFRAAFDRLDRQNRSTNFVRLLDLRRELPAFDRERFDAGLRQLRIADEFTLDSHEGRHGPLTEGEREAGVREGGSLLVYVSRRS